MSVVSDASVLIFLGKARYLELINSLFQTPYYLPDLIRNEVFAKELPPSEVDYLQEGLKSWEIFSWRPRIVRLAGGLSPSDISVLEVAKKVHAEWVFADEKALRQVLAVRKHKVIGTLGIFALACRKGLLTAKDARTTVDELVSNHRFRISAETYATFLKLLFA